MSAVPKRNHPDFWMETRAEAAELILPETIEQAPRKSRETARTAPRSIGRRSEIVFTGFERALSLAIVVFVLMTLSVIGLNSLLTKTDAHETRVSIQNVSGDIGRLRQDIQEARADLDTFGAPEGMGTLPIEPGDVSMVPIPPQTQ